MSKWIITLPDDCDDPYMLDMETCTRAVALAKRAMSWGDDNSEYTINGKPVKLYAVEDK